MHVHAQTHTHTHTKIKKVSSIELKICLQGFTFLNSFPIKQIAYVSSIAFPAESKDLQSAKSRKRDSLYPLAKNWGRTLKRNTALEIHINHYFIF